jgi:hypothetical protein
MLTINQRRALTLLANATYGCTVPYMLSLGCTVAVLRHLDYHRSSSQGGQARDAHRCPSAHKRRRAEDAGAIGSGCGARSS